MNLKSISTQLLYTTVPIWGETNDGNIVSGTGFIYSLFPDKNQSDTSIPLLITNFHVLQDVKRGIFELTLSKEDKPQKGDKIKVEFNGMDITKNKLEDLDIVAIPIASILNGLKSRNISIFYRTISPEITIDDNKIAELQAIEDIVFIGYPSGLIDSVNSSPIIRKGITATPIWNNFNGDDVFLIDAGVFPGSSGSPVFILNEGAYSSNDGITLGNRIIFLGVISETLVRKDQIYLGLGKVIKSNVILKKLEKLISNFQK